MFRIRVTAPLLLILALVLPTALRADPIRAIPSINPNQPTVSDYLTWERINRIPEPASMSLLGIGSITLGSFLRRRFNGSEK